MKEFLVAVDNLTHRDGVLKGLLNKKYDNFWFISPLKFKKDVLFSFDLAISFDSSFYNIYQEQLDQSVFNLLADLESYFCKKKSKIGFIVSDKKWKFNCENILIEESPRKLKELVKKEIRGEITAADFKQYVENIIDSFQRKGINSFFIALNGKENLFNSKRVFTPFRVFNDFSLKRLSYKGALIVIEGIDGTGKSTQAKLLLEYFKSKGIKVIKFREPSDSKWGKLIREKSSEKDSLSPEEQLDLFLKDREYNFFHNLLPYLKKGYLVILDRYYHSTYSYQGAFGIDKKRILKENLRICSPPEMLFILDLPVEVAWKRIGDRKKDNLFENIEFLKKVRENYYDFWGKDIHYINADQRPSIIMKYIVKKIEERFPLSLFY